MHADSTGLSRRDLVHRFLPFAAVGLLALGTAAVPPLPTRWGLFAAAAALTCLVAAAGVVVPWHRLPRWAYVLPSLSYFVVVALLREAQGGSASGYAALAILPIVWVALTLRMREVALAVAAGAAVHLTPVILVGGDQYPSSEWRRAMLWVAVGTLVGFAVNSLVRQARSQAAAAAERAEELAASEATIAAVMEVARAVDGPTDARRHACRAARELAAASFAIVGEPAPERELRVTASNGFAGEVPQMSRDGGCAAAFASCRRVVALDADHSAFVSNRLARGSLTSTSPSGISPTKP
jgi:hypothetical protein